MKVLIGIVVFIIIEIGFVIFMYASGTRSKEVDGQILQIKIDGLKEVLLLMKRFC